MTFVIQGRAQGQNPHSAAKQRPLKEFSTATQEERRRFAAHEFLA